MAATTRMTAEYDFNNAAAIYALVAEGMTLRQFPNEIIDVLYRTTQDLFFKLLAVNLKFKELLESQVAFCDRSYGCLQVADSAFDAMMLLLKRTKK